MYTNADITLYRYSKNGNEVIYTRFPIRKVFWDEVSQSTFLKTGQKDVMSVLIVIPKSSITERLQVTEGKDLVIKGIVADEIDCSNEESIAKSLDALKKKYKYSTVVSIDSKLFGSEAVQHYELSCK